MFIHAALCDNDGTLSDTEPILHSAWAALVAKDRKDFRSFDYAKIIGKPELECCRIVLAHFGLEHDSAEWHEDYKVIFYALAAKGVPLRPGVLAFLDRLDQARIPAAIVTSGTMDHVEKVLGSTGILSRFKTLVTADTPGLTARKPDPAPYLLAARKLDADPALCFAFEDTPTGIASASAAGCLTVGIPHAYSPEEGLSAADLLIPSLDCFTSDVAELAFAFHCHPWV